MKKTQHCYYCIDLESANPEVMEYTESLLIGDLEHFKVSDPLDLATYDWRVFKNEADADKWLRNYFTIFNKMPKKPKRDEPNYEKKMKKYKKQVDAWNREHCKSRFIPAILYKRRYMAMTLLGEKFKTKRHYRKNWRPGDLFNLHDQTLFLTMRLRSLTEIDGEFHYDFEFP